MRQAGLQGVRRGKKHFTTRRDERAARPPDMVERDFTAEAPNEKWFADITYVRTWSGFCYVAFVEDALSRMVVGWSIATHLRTSLATEALEMAFGAVASIEGLVHHSDAGGQYTPVAYSVAWPNTGSLRPSGASGTRLTTRWPSRPPASKTELYRRHGPWRRPA